MIIEATIVAAAILIAAGIVAFTLYKAVQILPAPTTHVELVAVRTSSNVTDSKVDISVEVGEIHGADSVGTTALQVYNGDHVNIANNSITTK